jgi:hypothetical protein
MLTMLTTQEITLAIQQTTLEVETVETFYTLMTHVKTPSNTAECSTWYFNTSTTAHFTCN